MFVINLSIDEIDELSKIGVVRIKPKHTPKLNEMCTYEYGYINKNNKFFKINKTQIEYGNHILLTIKILNLLNNKN